MERALLDLNAVLPDGAVVTDREVRAAHARDESEAEVVLPDAVVMVRSAEQVSHVMRVAHRHRVPVTPRAGGTGRTGGAACVAGGLVLAFQRMDRLHEINEADGVAVVEPGVVLGSLHQAVEAQGLFYPPDPNSLDSCTLGGNIAENAGGPRAYKYGVTRDYVLGLSVVRADGTAMELGRRTRKGVTGYDLTSLVVGSEGTLALVTRATLRLVPRPEAVRTLLIGLSREDTLDSLLCCLNRMTSPPRCVELFDRETLEVLGDAAPAFPAGVAKALLLVELDGDEADLERRVETAGNALLEAGALDVLVAQNAAERARLWGLRRQMSRALRKRAAFKLSEDVVVPRSKLGALLEASRTIRERHRVRGAAYGHAGDANLHVNFLWDTPDERVRVDRAIEALFRETLALGGTLSGEHGIGVLKAPFLPLEQSAAVLDLSKAIKAQWDPAGILNPGKILPPGGQRWHGPC